MKYDQFKSNFAYKGKSVYVTIFEANKDRIKTKKEKFAVNNLEKIFKATFKISSKIGFHEMSLRDLCRETGLSMGGIYSCIQSKDIIAIFIKDIVQLVSMDIVDTAFKRNDPNQALEEIIRHSIYAADILHPWFYFLYFETRCLPKEHQQNSKNIELNMIEKIEVLVSKISPGKKAINHHFIATMVLVMIQERYLKHWKYKNDGSNIDEHADEIVKLVHSALSY
jgi:AcrR family transcriptional regulator